MKINWKKFFRRSFETIGIFSILAFIVVGIVALWLYSGWFFHDLTSDKLVDSINKLQGYIASILPILGLLVALWFLIRAVLFKARLQS